MEVNWQLKSVTLNGIVPTAKTLLPKELHEAAISVLLEQFDRFSLMKIRCSKFNTPKGETFEGARDKTILDDPGRKMESFM